MVRFAGEMNHGIQVPSVAPRNVLVPERRLLADEPWTSWLLVRSPALIGLTLDVAGLPPGECYPFGRMNARKGGYSRSGFRQKWVCSNRAPRPAASWRSDNASDRSPRCAAIQPRQRSLSPL